MEAVEARALFYMNNHKCRNAGVGVDEGVATQPPTLN